MFKPEQVSCTIWTTFSASLNRLCLISLISLGQFTLFIILHYYHVHLYIIYIYKLHYLFGLFTLFLICWGYFKDKDGSHQYTWPFPFKLIKYFKGNNSGPQLHQLYLKCSVATCRWWLLHCKHTHKLWPFWQADLLEEWEPSKRGSWTKSTQQWLPSVMEKGALCIPFLSSEKPILFCILNVVQQLLSPHLSETLRKTNISKLGVALTMLLGCKFVIAAQWISSAVNGSPSWGDPFQTTIVN